MDQTQARKILQDLMKREDLKNKVCNDCSNTNPQWASLSFAVFICLECAGVHRGFGVHISFVRSISMDTWHEDQIKRMQIAGGNGAFKEFMRTYPSDTAGFKPGDGAHELYHSWAATEYRAKLDAEVAGKSWSPSAPPVGFGSPGSGTSSPARPSSAQGLRKSRTSRTAQGSSGLRNDSPGAFSPPSPQQGGSSAFDQKAANENYFASLGQTNALRPDDLPPSQGGRYQGFGSTPSPAQDSSQQGSFALSSKAAPTLNEFQENPMAALSKGWGLFSAAVAGASRAVNDSVIQPGLERARDPELHATVRGYASEAQRRAGYLGQSANDWSRHTLGIDVAEQVGGIVGGVRDRVGPGGGGRPEGYSSLSQHYDGESSTLYHDNEEGEEDFFDAHTGPIGGGTSTAAAANSTQRQPAASSAKPAAKNDEWDNEWQDF